jgi:RNA polymerase sigma-70 factor (ECF subfamily)
MSTIFATALAGEPQLLEAARGGDEAAYRRLVERHRGELHAHCYRMLGSTHDAEDALQDALLRAWKGLPRFAARSSFRAWLYKIATNAALDAISRRPKRTLPIDDVPPADPNDSLAEPLVESIWVEPYPDETLGVEDGFAAPEATYERRESVELAFIVALQHLPARQRAVLILREVLGFSAREAADTLDSTTQSVNSALQRARSTLEERLPERSQQATLRTLGDDRVRQVVESYMEAMDRCDVDAVVDMLTEEVAWAMPPVPTWFRGLDSVRRFLAKRPLSGDWEWRRLPARANGQLAVAGYIWDGGESAFLPFNVDVLTLEGDRIAEVTAFIVRSTEPEERESYDRWPDQAVDERRLESLFDSFGLPPRLDR